jgi:hypothetical protein
MIPPGQPQGAPHPSPAAARIPAPPAVDRCVLCDQRGLTAAHVIPESIGGSWKPRLLCGNCNSAFGGVVERDIHLDATLRLSHEHFRWVLPHDRRWVREYRREKQFYVTVDGKCTYVRYDDDGTRHTSTDAFPDLDGPFEHALMVTDPAVVVMAWLTASFWLGDLVRQSVLQPMRDAILSLARGEVSDDAAWLASIGATVETAHRRTPPMPYHQLQLAMDHGGVTVWVTIAGYDLYGVHLPIGVPCDLTRLGVVMDLRSGRPGFNLLPDDGDRAEPRWAVDWESQLMAEVAAAHPARAIRR